jgi:hypothetical protein
LPREVRHDSFIEDLFHSQRPIRDNFGNLLAQWVGSRVGGLTMPKFKHLPDLSDPHYAIIAPSWIMQMFRVAAWAATAAFFVWGVPAILKHGENLWAMWVMGSLLALISIGLATPSSFRPLVNFACDTEGVFIFYERNKTVFVPWVAVRDIRIETIVGSGGRSLKGLLVEAKIDDEAIRAQLFRKHILSDKDPVDAEGYGCAGISNNARSMPRALAEINHIRGLAGLPPFSDLT